VPSIGKTCDPILADIHNTTLYTIYKVPDGIKENLLKYIPPPKSDITYPDEVDENNIGGKQITKLKRQTAKRKQTIKRKKRKVGQVTRRRR